MQASQFEGFFVFGSFQHHGVDLITVAWFGVALPIYEGRNEPNKRLALQAHKATS